MTEFRMSPPESSRKASPGAAFLVREMWTSLAISVIWLSVLCAAIFGPDIVSNNGVGESESARSCLSSCRGAVRFPRDVGCRKVRLRVRP